MLRFLVADCLAHLAQRLQVQVPPGTSLFHLLCMLIKHILNCSDNDMTAILAQRVQQQTLLDEYLDDPDLDELVEDADRKDLKDHRDNAAKQRVQHNDFVCKLRAFRSSVVSVGKSSTSRQGGKHSNKDKRKLVNSPPGDNISLEGAKALLPPGRMVQHDNFNAGWRVCHERREHFARSRSWGLYGYKESFLLCCRYAWECSEASQDITCWVPGL